MPMLPTLQQLQKYTIQGLRLQAKTRGYRRYSRLRRAELAQLLLHPPPDYEAIKERKNEERRRGGEYTKKELAKVAKNAGIREYYKLKKDDLEEKLRESFLHPSILSVQEPPIAARHNFKFQRTASAFNRFTNVYKMKGRDGYDPI